MPREIIDTVSSRPRYVRRVALTAAAGVVGAVLVILAAVWAYGHLLHAAVPGK